MTTPLHTLIKQRREQLGIGKGEIAERIGVSFYEYVDVERYDTEITDVLPLKNVRSLSAVLGFELGTLLGVGSLVGKPSASNKPRHTLLAEARNKLGVSVDKMADEIGYDESFVHSLETDDEVLETCPYDTLRMVAEYLMLDPADLLYAASE
jgi:DNA-binding XRE family transcriptional regulator